VSDEFRRKPVEAGTKRPELFVQIVSKDLELFPRSQRPLQLVEDEPLRLPRNEPCPRRHLALLTGPVGQWMRPAEAGVDRDGVTGRLGMIAACREWGQGSLHRRVVAYE